MRRIRVLFLVCVARFGTDGSDDAVLASGHVDLVVGAGPELHDITTLVPITQRAPAESREL